MLMTACMINTANAQELISIAVNKYAPPTPAVKVILQQAYDNIGVPIEFKEYSHKRSLVHVNEGDADAEAFRIKGIEDKFPNLRMVDVPLRRDPMHLYVKRGKEFVVDGFTSIPKDYIVGYQRGLLFAEYGLKEQGIIRSEFTSVEQVAKHLKTGRSDAVILGAISEELFSRFDRLNVIKLEPPIHNTVLYHYVHKNNAYLIPRLTEALLQMQSNGQIEAINKDIPVYEGRRY